MFDDFPNRQTVRLREYDYSNNGLYFITICTSNHENLFGKIVNGNMVLNEIGKIVEIEILNTAIIRPNIKIDQCIIMPNHIHLIIQIVGATRWVARNPDKPNPDKPNNKTTLKSGTIGAIIGQIKSISLKKAQKSYCNMNIRPCNNDEIGRDICAGVGRNICAGVGRPTGSPLRWQRNYHEHIIRDEKSYNIIVDYIRNNPLKWENDKFYRE